MVLLYPPPPGVHARLLFRSFYRVDRCRYIFSSKLRNSLLSPFATSLHRNMSSSDGSRHLNRLSQAKSPYLLQHAENPVEWYEWGMEAFEKAKQEEKPIFLSVGYSACHWCHVLAHESFEDEVTAKLMNDHYVNIKVDREERPDVDRLYMTFLQATTGGGGWPMSVWLTPELHPFFAGTYFPPGQFRQVLMKLADVWESEPERCRAAGKDIIEQLRIASNVATSSAIIPVPSLASSVFSRLQRLFDVQYGGFGAAPKFPQTSSTIHFLARYAAFNMGVDKEKMTEAEAARDMAVQTMVKIYNGGIRDVVGGGFARYSVDERWHIPHFEKMLYDQAQLLSCALELFQLLPAESPQRATLRAMAADIVSYVARDLRSPEGGFYSAEDADSLPSADSTVKKEGAFYVWTVQQLEELLARYTRELRGQNVLYTAHTLEETAEKFSRPVDEVRQVLDASLAKMKRHRDQHRPRPHLDDKILTCWNGLMISGLSRAAEALNEDLGLCSHALELAEESAAFIRSKLYNEASGELWRSYRQGQGPTGQADDYAFLVQGLLDLYEASAKEEYMLWAIRLQEKQDDLFYDEKEGGYFASAPDEHILVRMKDAQDGAEPSAASITLSNLHRLAHFAEDRHAEYQEKAQSILTSNGQILAAAPFALAAMVSTALMAERGYKQLILSEPRREGQFPSLFLQTIRGLFIPNRVLIHLDTTKPPRELCRVNATLRSLISDLDNLEGDAAAMVPANVRVCEIFTCGLPIEDVEELKGILR